MSEDEMKPKNGLKNGETTNGKISAGEKEKMATQTKGQSKINGKNKLFNKINGSPKDDTAEGKSASVTNTKSAEGNIHLKCKCSPPTQKINKIMEIRENNSSNFRIHSRALTTYKGQQTFEAGLLCPKKPKLKLIHNKMAAKDSTHWVNTNNCALNIIQNFIQNGGRKAQYLQKSKPFQRSSAMNASSNCKPFKKSRNNNNNNNDNNYYKRFREADSAILNNLKMYPKTDDIAVHTRGKHSGNKEGASQNVHTSKTDSTEERCVRRTNAWALDPTVNDNTQFINSYPSIYVSQAGLINIFLRWGIILEVTADKVLRLVDRRQNMAIAVSRKGKVCSIHHPSAKIIQNEKSADAELCGRWQVRRRMNHVLVGDRTHSVWIDDLEKYGTVEYKKHQFLDMSFDNTVNIPCSSPTYGPWAMTHCMNLVTSARFGRTRNSSLFVHLNDIHITQKQCGDVIVRTDTAVLRMRPKFGSIEAETLNADIVTALGKEIRCYFKESLTFSTSRQGLSISNGKVEASMLNSGRIEFFKLPGRIPLSH